MVRVKKVREGKVKTEWGENHGDKLGHYRILQPSLIHC